MILILKVIAGKITRTYTEFSSTAELEMVRFGLCLLQGGHAVLAEPWVVEAVQLFFKQRRISATSYAINRELLLPFLSSQSKGPAVMDQKIIDHVTEAWTGRALDDLPLFLWARDHLKRKGERLPYWWGADLSIPKECTFQDNSECTTLEEDCLPGFLSGEAAHSGIVAILPSTLAGPDVVLKTSDPTVFVVFTSALSLRGRQVSATQKRQNEKATDLSLAYTRKNGQTPAWPKQQSRRRSSLRCRHERVSQAACGWRGLIRIHIRLPYFAAGSDEMTPDVRVETCRARQDLLIHVGLATLLSKNFVTLADAALFHSLSFQENHQNI